MENVAKYPCWALTQQELKQKLWVGALASCKILSAINTGFRTANIDPFSRKVYNMPFLLGISGTQGFPKPMYKNKNLKTYALKEKSLKEMVQGTT